MDKVLGYLKERWWLIAAGLCITLIAHGPVLFDHYVINGDSSAILLWMNGLSLDEAGPNAVDIMTAYARYFVSLGTKAVYSLLGLFMQPITAVKILPLITVTASVVMMYDIGAFIGGRIVARLSGGIFLLLAWYHRNREMFGSADSEEISIVLMLGFLAALLKRKFGWISIILFASALTYPPLFVLELGALCIFFVLEIWQKKDLPVKGMAGVFCVAAVLGSCGYLVFHVFLGAPDFLGRILTYQEILAEGMFNIGGNTPMFGDGSIAGRIFNDVTGIGMDAPKAYLLFGFLCFLFLPSPLFQKKLHTIFPRELWCFIASGIFLTIIANCLMMRLYQPSRYIQIPLNIFLIIFVACAFACLEECHARLGRRLKIFFLLGFFVIVLPRLYGYFDGPFRERLFVPHIKKLPDTSFLAGHPTEMNGIGLFAKKRIFLTKKMATEVYWEAYRDIMTDRTQDFFRAYYADTKDAVETFAQRYGITHIVVYQRHFRDAYFENGRYYDNPFNDFIRAYINDRRYFYLKEKTENYQQAHNLHHEIFLLDCQSMEVVYSSELLSFAPMTAILGKGPISFVQKKSDGY